jgi:hypothetical protein
MTVVDEEKLDLSLSAMFRRNDLPLITQAARSSRRKLSAYVRDIVHQDLIARGLLDDRRKPTNRGQTVIDEFKWPDDFVE